MTLSENNTSINVYKVAMRHTWNTICHIFSTLHVAQAVLKPYKLPVDLTLAESIIDKG